MLKMTPRDGNGNKSDACYHVAVPSEAIFMADGAPRLSNYCTQYRVSPRNYVSRCTPTYTGHGIVDRVDLFSFFVNQKPVFRSGRKNIVERGAPKTTGCAPLYEVCIVAFAQYCLLRNT